MDGQDTFPTDASEWQDTDADSIGDNSDLTLMEMNRK